MAALALTRAGDTAGAEKLAAELDKTFPLATLAQRYWLPTIRAAVAIEHKDANRAVELLKETSPIELGAANNFVILVPIYVRDEAYLAQAVGKRAATHQADPVFFLEGLFCAKESNCSKFRNDGLKVEVQRFSS